MMKTSRFKGKGGNLFTRKFSLYFLIVMGFLSLCKPIQASESEFSLEDHATSWQPVFSLDKGVENTPFYQQPSNKKDLVLKLSGLDPDDNGLGEVPVGNGYFILVGFCLLFITYRLAKQSSKLRLFFNKRVYFILMLLALFQTASFATNYYWVGAGGNWSDINHWATTSGGTTKFTLPPTAADDVFFDANSGFTSLNRTVYFGTSCLCRNLSSQGAAIGPILGGTAGSLEVWGNFYISPETELSYAAIAFRSSTPGATITTSGKSIYTPTFNGTGGWKLMDSFTSPNQVTFTSGSLDFNGQTVNMSNFSSSSSSTRTLNIAGSTINCNQGGWDYTGAGSSVLTNAQTVGSTISIINGLMTAKDGDKYYNVEMREYGNYYGAPYYVTGGSYNKLSSLLGNLNISTSTSIIADTLILNANAIYNFSKPTTVNKYLSMSPASICGGMIDIASGTINMGASGTVYGDHVRIRNTTIAGPGALYAVNNSINAGGNTGWNFLTTTGNTYYWVGGTGNWNDVSHWASASGGTGGSGCVPSLLDNAIFDDNSGFTSASKTISLDVVGYCNDLKFLGTTNAPTFQKATSILPSLEVGGSLYLQAGMTFNPNSFTMSSDRSTETITSNGVVIPVETAFKSATGIGGWKMMDAFASAGVRFYRGYLDFNGQNITISGDFRSAANTGEYSATRGLNIANSTITAYTWMHTGGIALDVAHSINSLIQVTSTSTSTNGSVAKGGDHYYNLELAGRNTPVSAGIYNKITYLPTAVSGGSFDSNVETDSLLFQCSGTFTFNTNMKVNKYLATKETCGGITVFTSNSSSERTIVMGNPSQVKVSNAQINAVSITGPGTPYVIPNSLKQGGIDAGWSFGAVVSNTFYWVGSTGNWNDQSHWATTSGGTPGSGCIPSPFDEVIFDNNSFSGPSQTVTVDGNAYCDSMSWVGNASLKPIFSIANPIAVYGSLILQTGMTIPTGTLALTSSRMGETIKSNGVVYPQISFSGKGGWMALDSISCKGDINLYDGNLNFNGQQIRMVNFNAGTPSPAPGAARSLNIANSTIYVGANSTTGYWEYKGEAPLTAAQSVNSLIVNEKMAMSFKAKPGDVYYNLFLNSRNGGYVSSVSQGIFNKVEFTCPGNLVGVTADSLILSPGGYTYTFSAGTTITVNKYLKTNGTPCLPTTIQSGTDKTQANFSVAKAVANVAPDTVLLEFVRIRDLNAVAGADRANLKKGPQSTDDGEYGLSGRNTNWTMVPYAGASGFEGLGKDLALGCTDYPYTIQLDPVYYAGAEGSYEWRKGNTSGPIIGTTPQLQIYNTGTYYIKVNYDLAKTCNLSDDKIVTTSADSLIWTGLAGTSDWNDWANWKKANGTSDVTTIPRACTDVLIPSGINVYPNLNLANTSRSVYNNAACRNIHFDPSAEVAFTDSLYYEKAFVDVKLQRDYWFMLSSPLKNMYSGDYWLAPFGVTAANGAAYNRNNPRVYIQQYQLQNPETGFCPGYASWSKAFNTLDVPLGRGQGFVVGIDQPGADQTFHFPRPETKMEYFSKATGLPAGQWTPTLDRSNAYRMHIEPGYSEIMPVSWDSISRSTLVVGNPFMSHLSFSALRAGNPGLFGTTYYVWTGASFDAFTVAGDQTSKTDWTCYSVNEIAPMQSVIIEKQDPSSVITFLNINSSMTCTAPGNNLRSNTESPFATINLAVYRDDARQSAATLLSEEGKDVPTLFSTSATESAVVYFGSKDKPFSIFSSDLAKEVEVGLKSTTKGMLTFKIQGMESLQSGGNVYLEDRLLGKTQDLRTNPTYTFNNETGDIEGRFYLKSTKNITGIDGLSNESNFRIYATDNTVYLASSGDPIQKVEVFNIQGQLIYKQDNLNLRNYSFRLNAGRQLVLVKVISGNQTKIEKIQLY